MLVRICRSWNFQQMPQFCWLDYDLFLKRTLYGPVTFQTFFSVPTLVRIEDRLVLGELGLDGLPFGPRRIFGIGGRRQAPQFHQASHEQ